MKEVHKVCLLKESGTESKQNLPELSWGWIDAITAKTMEKKSCDH